MTEERCETCTEHSGVESRLRTGNLIFGGAATILIAAFGIQTASIRSIGDDIASMREAVAEMRATAPMTQKSIEDLQRRLFECERAVTTLSRERR